MAEQTQSGALPGEPDWAGLHVAEPRFGTPPDPAHSARLLNEALDLGYDFLDTAAIYGAGANERLLGEAIGHRRGEYVLASKCGISGAKQPPGPQRPA